MLQILSSLTLLSRFDLAADSWILNSGKTGTFVAMNGEGVTKPTAGGMAFPIWSESNRDGSAGFSPDIAATGKVSVMYGKLKGITDQIDTTKTFVPGEKLYVDADGKLTNVSAGAGIVIAYCTKAKYTETYLSKKFTAIEFVLV